jgi:hypothetical protein
MFSILGYTGFVIEYADVVGLPRVKYEGNDILDIPQCVGCIAISRGDAVDIFVVELGGRRSSSCIVTMSRG